MWRERRRVSVWGTVVAMLFLATVGVVYDIITPSRCSIICGYVADGSWTWWEALAFGCWCDTSGQSQSVCLTVKPSRLIVGHR